MAHYHYITILIPVKHFYPNIQCWDGLNVGMG